MMERRAFLGVLATSLVIAPVPVAAQQAKQAPRIGLLFPIAKSQLSVHMEAIEAGFRDVGYSPGQSIILEYRFAEGHFDRLPALAEELVNLKVDVIVSVATQATLAAKAVTTTIPIVMVSVGDSVGTGIVASLARPGGHVTGLGIDLEEIMAKMPELLKEALPKIARVALLTDPTNPGARTARIVISDASRKLGLQLIVYEGRTAEDIEPAFQSMVRDHAHGVIVPVHPFTYQHRERIVKAAASHRLSAVYGARAFVAAGGLMCYGFNEVEVFRRTATYVDKILKGAKPADLPVELPTKFELVINLKTAKALGLNIPRSLLARATELIQ
jgi:putative ABC transport system substrate-binding protein